MTLLQRQIVERLDRGLRNRDIVRELGCTPTAVSYVKHGRRGRYITSAKHRQIKELWFAGDMGANQIAERVRIAEPLVIAYIQELEREEDRECRA